MLKLFSGAGARFTTFLKRKAYAWGSGDSVQWYGGFPFYMSDRKVTLDNSSVIQICMGWEGRNFCEPPGCVVTMSASGTPEIDYEHDLVQLFKRPEPEGKMTGRRLYKAILANRRYDGNAYVDVIKNQRGNRVVELRSIPYWACEPVAAKGTGVLDHYEIKLRDGKRESREIDQILHFADGIDDQNPLKGCSALKSAQRLVMTDEAAVAAGQRLMEKLGVIGLFVSPKDPMKTINDHDRDVLTAKLNQQFAGENQGGAFVASSSINVDYLGVDVTKLGLRELSRLPEERISAIFGYAAIVVGLGAGLDRSTFANFAEAREAATEQTLVPLWSEISDDITVQLGPLFGLKANQSFAFDLKNVKILQEDENSKWSRLGEAYQNGGIKRGEYRTGIGYDEAPEDDVYITDLQAGGVADAGKAAAVGKSRTAMAQRMRDSRRTFEAIQEQV